MVYSGKYIIQDEMMYTLFCYKDVPTTEIENDSATSL